MPRRKVISDAAVLDLGLAMLAHEGAHGPSFGDLARKSGLAPSTLAQRFGSQPGLFAAILAQGWDRAEKALAEAALARPPESGGNPVPFLKALGAGLDAAGLSLAHLVAGSMKAPTLLARASAWRQGVEAALQKRLDPSNAGQDEAAAALFAAWQGRMLWAATVGGEFRLRAVARRRKGQK